MQAEICTGFAVSTVQPVFCVPVIGKLAANIRRFRKSKGLTQLELAVGIGIQTATQISLWENERQKVSPENVRKLSQFFGVSITELDPDREAWDAEKPRAERIPPPSHSHVAAPPPPSIGVAMGSGEPALFEQVEGAWKLLRNDEERRAFVEHVRGFVHLSTAPEAARKKAAR
jgi:transcriptional regulator with XRE-family HTH domain